MVSDTDAFGSPETDALELVLSSEPSPQAAPPAPEPPAPEPYESETVVLPQPGEPSPEPAAGLDLLDGVDPEPEYVPALIDGDDEPMVLDQPVTTTDAEPVQAEDTLMAGDDYGDVL
ncbi:hypothetical protein GCM10022223_42310 [Kineosporia mesophila]|uniref:Uncharacterized protein n=1 Tax=Kineosporia mesophila TaxID=566012 RepID=A0ABP6ZW71_9ACTN|nr:hypothetical protein [Kineosporia mesophila]MCD5353327.1 hypothetical protein [Kineosporia mesophila]